MARSIGVAVPAESWYFRSSAATLTGLSLSASSSAADGGRRLVAVEQAAGDHDADVRADFLRHLLLGHHAAEVLQLLVGGLHAGGVQLDELDLRHAVARRELEIRVERRQQPLAVAELELSLDEQLPQARVALVQFRGGLQERGGQPERRGVTQPALELRDIPDRVPRHLGEVLGEDGVTDGEELLVDVVFAAPAASAQARAPAPRRRRRRIGGQGVGGAVGRRVGGKVGQWLGGRGASVASAGGAGAGSCASAAPDARPNAAVTNTNFLATFLIGPSFGTASSCARVRARANHLDRHAPRRSQQPFGPPQRAFPSYRRVVRESPHRPISRGHARSCTGGFRAAVRRITSAAGTEWEGVQGACRTGRGGRAAC